MGRWAIGVRSWTRRRSRAAPSPPRRRPLRSLALALALALIVALRPSAGAAQPAPPADWAIAHGRFYTQTGGGGRLGFAVVDDDAARFWTAYQRLGGVDALGYPASQRFMWDGFLVQVFQRVVLQWRPERGTVAFVNVFDRLHDAGQDDWLRQARAVPPPRTFDDAGKPWAEVVRSHLAVLDRAPAIAAAYRAAPGDPIESNGLPVSDVIDAGDVLVLRCQRVVFQQWKVDVPWARAGQVTVALGGDIAKEAGILPDPAALRPIVAPAAETPARGATIVLDPGHGGDESGATRGLPRLIEKELVLDIAHRLRERLRERGDRVVLTREGDLPVNVPPRDLNGDGKVDVDDDLQARVDISNQAEADVFLSLHANGGPPALRGVSTFYCRSCPGAPAHLRFARSIQAAVLSGLAPSGAGAWGQGVLDEAGLGKPYGHLFVIGPRTPRVARELRAPAAALIELLFISNAQDAALLARDDVRATIADALAAGIASFLGR